MSIRIESTNPKTEDPELNLDRVSLVIADMALLVAQRGLQRTSQAYEDAIEDGQIDKLTNLYNQVAFKERLDSEVGFGIANDIPVAFAFVDLNDFIC